jgi:hypothetical protein
MNIINKIVLIFFSLLLATLLVLVVINLNNSKYKFSPIISDCPDYWSIQVDPKNNNNITCLNTKNLGTCNIPKFSITKQELKLDSIRCMIKKTLNMCKFTWDGISNNDRLKC